MSDQQMESFQDRLDHAATMEDEEFDLIDIYGHDPTLVGIVEGAEQLKWKLTMPYDMVPNTDIRFKTRDENNIS